MITTRFIPIFLGGSSGWQWEHVRDGKVIRWGWSAGKLKDAEQDSDEALRKATRTQSDKDQMWTPADGATP